MRTFLVLLCSVLCCSAIPLESPSSFPAVKDDAYLTVPELIRKYGYHVEEHYAITPDGYVLTLHRIPHGKNSNKVSDRVVFLQHGLVCSSAVWIITGVDHGLGYILADAGYDVWMGNARGNKYSRNNTCLNPIDAEFWKFSWHQIGAIDLPTMIDYVLEATSQSSLFHVGHSQGTTTFYVMTSMHPEYNEKIRAHISLAPIAYMNHITNPLMHAIAFFTGTFEALAELIGVNEFHPSNKFMARIAGTLCKDGAITEVLCTNVFFVIGGFNPVEINATLLPILIGHLPAGASVKQLIHYGQEIISGAFRQFDFGMGNQEHYGQSSPPDYDLKAITAPIYLFYSHHDSTATETDVERLCEVLEETCKEKFLISDKPFNHVDYLFGISAPKLVYKKVIDVLARYH